MVGMALTRAWKHMSWFYDQYLLVTVLYMLEPWERTVFNSMLVSVVGMALYTGCVFMAQHIMAILYYLEIVPSGCIYVVEKDDHQQFQDYVTLTALDQKRIFPDSSENKFRTVQGWLTGSVLEPGSKVSFNQV
ncbi:PREDICTED: serine palmitoyltransferase small subunit A-like [Galeopterus variegatus]|uniref:Serine palmitoyltransferase small subunit A-like n=1 Tax=Galeopterus variegatus TaxID=482537 RepID=A0ABM0R4A5_GALVR|nr:PREDICTED: serine palmitoyltransferase small subunit A-like [Galeopterus variegatus]